MVRFGGGKKDENKIEEGSKTNGCRADMITCSACQGICYVHVWHPEPAPEVGGRQRDARQFFRL